MMMVVLCKEEQLGVTFFVMGCQHRKRKKEEGKKEKGREEKRKKF
jgi:hypothetical protein